MANQDLTELAVRIVTKTATALARDDGHPLTARVLREYREQAIAAATAALRAFSDGMDAPVYMSTKDGPRSMNELIAAVRAITEIQ